MVGRAAGGRSPIDGLSCLVWLGGLRRGRNLGSLGFGFCAFLEVFVSLDCAIEGDGWIGSYRLWFLL